MKDRPALVELSLACVITDEQLYPQFRNNDYEGGLAAGIDSIFKAIRGEYKGTGETVTERRGRSGPPSFLFFIVFVVILMVISRVMRRFGGYGYSSRRSGPVFIPMGFGGGGVSWSSRGGSGFGGVMGGGVGGGCGGGVARS